MKTKSFKCPSCGDLQVTGTFTKRNGDKPFRVVFQDHDGKQVFVEANTLEMARGFACEKPTASIQEGVQPPTTEGGL